MRRALAVLVLLLCGPPCFAQSAGPVLAVQGDRFTIDGAPAFLIFVSYFDALRAPRSAWNTDLDWLAKAGISGVRVFGSWHNYCTGAPVADALIGPHGAVNAARMSRLRQFVAAAAQRRLVVDLSFDNQIGTDGITLAEYKSGLTAIARQLAPYRNVIVDVDNEYQLRSIEGRSVGDPDVSAMLESVRQGGGIPVTASRVEDARAAGAAARLTGADVVAYHDPRDHDRWFTDARTAQLLNDLRAGLAPSIKPVYFQEPMAFDAGCKDHRQTDPDLKHAAAAVAAAKRAGAAAWTFHTRYSFDLAGKSLHAVLPAAHRTAIESLRRTADTLTLPKH